MAHASLPHRILARLRNLQRAPEPERKRWLVVASAAAMVVVIALWVAYLNLTVPSAGPGPEVTAGEEKMQGDSLGKTLGRGFATIADEFNRKWEEVKERTSEALENLQSTVEQQNQFTFEAATGTQAGPSELTPVPPSPLPEAPLKTP